MSLPALKQLSLFAGSFLLKFSFVILISRRNHLATTIFQHIAASLGVLNVDCFRKLNLMNKENMQFEPICFHNIYASLNELLE